MKAALSTLLEQVVLNLKKDGVLADDVSVKIVIEHTRDPSHGDFASNLAMMLAKPAGQKPRDLAEKIIAALPENTDIDKVEIAGPGFINFFMNANTLTTIVPAILDAGEAFGHSTIGKGKRVQVEFVSANPTGPLHVGHGRGAAYGAAVADLLAAAGFQVHREYYVNDAGRQMDILCASVWIRYLSLCGTLPDPDYFPVNGYKGDMSGTLLLTFIATMVINFNNNGLKWPPHYPQTKMKVAIKRSLSMLSLSRQKNV